MLRRFEDTERLTTAELRALLGAAHPEHRVWALWELALRVGRGTEIAAHLDPLPHAPNPGVRRMLVVVLAGHAEHDLVVALGHHDPDAMVRAQAMQLVTRLAVAGTIDPAVVTQAFAREVPVVRAAVLDAIAAGPPPWLEELAHDALRGEPASQLDAFEAVLRIGSHRERAVQWIVKARGELAMRAWQRWPHVMPGGEIVTLLAGMPGALRVAAIRLLAIPIDALERLTIPGSRAIFDAVRDRGDFAATPITILARAILEGFAVGYLELVDARLTAGCEVTPELVVLLRELRAHCAARRAAVERAELLPDERPPTRWNARGHYLRVIAACDRVLRQPTSV